MDKPEGTHTLHEWDDPAAAEAYRRQQAEACRRQEKALINAEGRAVLAALEAEGGTVPVEGRAFYTKKYGQVWTTTEMQQDFEVLGFAAYYAVVRRRSDGQKGSLDFAHSPRFYFDFKPDRQPEEQSEKPE